jgi:hypothetical protein
MDRRLSACSGNGQASQVGMDSEFQLDLDVSPMVPFYALFVHSLYALLYKQVFILFWAVL